MAPRFHTLRRALIESVRNRRGVTNVAFIASASAVFGMAALATEGGTWYLARRNAQNAADAAALAATAMLAHRGSSPQQQAAAMQAAIEVAARNGFAADGGRTTVTVTPRTWAAAGDPNAAQVDITQTQTMGLGRLLFSRAPTVRVSSVASLVATGIACTLSRTGTTAVTGTSTVEASNCALASNQDGPTSFQIDGSARLTAYSVRAVGQCSGCDRAILTVPPMQDAVPAEDPYESLLRTTPPTFSNSECQPRGSYVRQNVTENGRTINLYTPQPWPQQGKKQAICDDIRINTANDVLRLVPGTYFFWRADLDVTNGRVECPTCTGDQGVTLVFTGDPDTNSNGRGIGSVNITGGSVDLRAPSAAPWQSSIYRGILIYRDWRATPNNTKNTNQTNNPNTVRIVGNANGVSLNGMLYLPSTAVQLGGNTTNTSTAYDCYAVVAATMTFTGNARLNIQGCDRLGTRLVQTRVVRTVQ